MLSPIAISFCSTCRSTSVRRFQAKIFTSKALDTEGLFTVMSYNVTSSQIFSRWFSSTACPEAVVTMAQVVPIDGEADLDCFGSRRDRYHISKQVAHHFWQWVSDAWVRQPWICHNWNVIQKGQIQLEKDRETRFATMDDHRFLQAANSWNRKVHKQDGRDLACRVLLLWPLHVVLSVNFLKNSRRFWELALFLSVFSRVLAPRWTPMAWMSSWNWNFVAKLAVWVKFRGIQVTIALVSQATGRHWWLAVVASFSRLFWCFVWSCGTWAFFFFSEPK